MTEPLFNVKCLAKFDEDYTFRFQRLIEMSIYYCRKSNPSRESTHQIEAATNQIKTRKFLQH